MLQRLLTAVVYLVVQALLAAAQDDKYCKFPESAPAVWPAAVFEPFINTICWKYLLLSVYLRGGQLCVQRGGKRRIQACLAMSTVRSVVLTLYHKHVSEQAWWIMFKFTFM